MPPDDPPTQPLQLPAARGSAVAAVLQRWLPPSWRRARLDPGRPGATALVLVAVVAAVLAAVGVWLERPQSAPVPALPAVAVSGTPTSGAPAAGVAAGPSALPAAGPLVVSVSGRVQRPGLVRVPDGSRVADVLTAAGGALPGTDLAGLNLARRVGDGEQIAVGVPPTDPVDAGPAAGPSAGADAPAPTGPIDLNTATAAQLDTLPGVGPVTVAHILDWRTRNGRFTRVEQLQEIDGIGERRFAQLRDLVTVR